MYSIVKELKEQLELVYLATDSTQVTAKASYAFGMINVARNMKMLTNESCNSWVEKIRKAKDERIKEIYT